MHGQGATEYLVILAVLVVIAIVASSLLGFLPGMGTDERKETYMVQLRAGEPFSVENYVSSRGKLSISFANKDGRGKNLSAIYLESEDENLTEMVDSPEFAGGMRKVVQIDVPCTDHTQEFEIVIIYLDDGVWKEERPGGKIVVEKCPEGDEVLPGEGCSVDGDCAAGTCVAGICQLEQGVCNSDLECESGNCNPLTGFCDPRPIGTCSPRCSVYDPAVVCEETIAGAECSGWEEENPQCSVVSDCDGWYVECSAECGGVCVGEGQGCGGGTPCCDGYSCSEGACVSEGGGEACYGMGGICNATNCCSGLYCSSNVSGTCSSCKTSGSCNVTIMGNCCEGYVCSTGYVSIDVPRSGTECGLPDGSPCTTHSQCINGTCYESMCKNCNTNNVCNIANGNGDCCFGKLCLKNQTGTYVCTSAVNVSGAYEYLYDYTWSMEGNPAVVYKQYSNGTSTEARVFGLKWEKACTVNEECLSNKCFLGACGVQIDGSWCSCSGSGYTTCDQSDACPTGLVCNPYNYTCVSLLSVPAANYGYLCRNSTLCYQQCYNNYSGGEFYTYCNQLYNVCREGGQACIYNAQCCSNSCVASLCAAQTAGSWCRVTSYTPEWPFGTPSTVVDQCGLLLTCVWNTTTTPFCQ